MALVLTVRCGDRITIGRSWLGISRVVDDYRIRIVTSDGRRITVGSRAYVSIFDKVSVCLDATPTWQRLRLLIAAPRQIPIYRQERAR